MFRHRTLPVLLAIIALVGAARAEDRVQAELNFAAHKDAEKTSGVWEDGQHVGYVKELGEGKKVTLLHDRDEVIVRQAWYKDYVEQVIVEPGQTRTVNGPLV